MYKCPKCSGDSPTSNTCENPDCPNMPCCGKPQEECSCYNENVLKEMKQEMEEFWLEEAKLAHERKLESEKQRDYVLTQIIYNKGYLDEYLEMDDWQHEAFVKVKKFNKNGKDYYKISEGFDLDLVFTKQDGENTDGSHCLIWQTVGYCEDDYSGYLMFPLKDGRYWLVSYSC